MLTKHGKPGNFPLLFNYRMIQFMFGSGVGGNEWKSGPIRNDSRLSHVEEAVVEVVTVPLYVQ